MKMTNVQIDFLELLTAMIVAAMAMVLIIVSFSRWLDRLLYCKTDMADYPRNLLTAVITMVVVVLTSIAGFVWICFTSGIIL